MTGAQTPSSFQLAYVPGVTPAKWVRIWHVLRDGGADAAFVRLPVDGTDLSAIPLYTETTVVVVPKDHVVAAVDEVSPAELADEIVLHPLDDTLDWERRPGQPAKDR
ncbi:LysR family transcriptional regulator, partial [Streptomyces varsoviensis]